MNHLYRFAVLLTGLFVCTCHTIYSQSATAVSPESGRSFFNRVTPRQLGPQQASAVLRENLPLSTNDQLVPLAQQFEQVGFALDKFQQYYKGVKVEHGIYKVHAKNGATHAISGEFYGIPDNLNVQPSLSKEQAVQKAIAYVGAQKYKWQIDAEEAWLKKVQNDPKATFYPEGELVICKIYRRNQVPVENGGLALAYKLDIYSQEPLSRAYIYVDAHTGAVIHQDAIIKHVDGVANTRFSGQRTISTTLSNNTYQLRDASRGLGVETYNMQSGSNYGSAIDFTDTNNQWTSAEHDNLTKDNAGLDGHWGAMKTYDYFKNVHGRNSFDGNGAKIKCYVHYGYKYVNAFWNGSVMTFGDGDMTGSTGVQPLTTLDITAHEIGHAVCQYTAGLVYSYESGAMNEGFSDIWGAMVEYYAEPTKSTWTMGEDANFTIRSMSNPNAHQHPDTYKGQYWYTGGGDNGGVHYNSGVLNHWFYLLCIGKTGVNDNGDSYNVIGIGIQKAARIAYRTESVYLTSNSEYSNARAFSIQSAIDLYGATSQEVIQTANAWDAVGVYEFVAAPSNLTATTISGTQINLSWADNTSNETGFQIERSATATGVFTQIATVGANVVTYQDKNLATDATYYYKVKAIKGTSFSAASNIASAVVGTPPLVMIYGNAITCSAKFLDPGGAGNYADYQSTSMTLSPTTTDKKLRITFTAFDTEAGYDILKVYDGSSTYAPLIGEYSGTTLPPVITATNPSGQLTFYFTSNYTTNRPGWQAIIACVTPPNAPGNLIATTASATQINLNWTDTASDETGFTIERSTTPNTGFVQVATVGVNVTTYANAALATNTRYYYRIRANRVEIYSAYSNEANAAVGNAPIIMSNGAITTCNAVFLDPGGAGNYGGNQIVIMALSPATAGKQISIAFATFSLGYYDYLEIYDGASTSSPRIGSYSGSTFPANITASNAAGQLTLRLYAYGSSGGGAGWQANISCVSPTAPSLVSLNPVRNSQNIYRYTDVVMNFSQLMQATTASSAAIKIHGSLSGLLTTPTGGYFYGMGTSTASFNPSAEFKSGETVSVTITSQAKNQAGLSMAIPQVYQFTAAASYAPANFVATTPVNVPASPFGMVAADFDKDGDIDLATAHFLAAGSVSIKLNNGMGGFTGTGSVAVGTNPRALVAADFDNDGDMDLATANQLSNDVSVRFNNGLGVFSGTSSVGVGTTPIGLTAADFDGDGDMDVATANYGANTISIRFNNGLGVFSGATQVAVGVQPSWVQAADVDRDGDMDLTIANAGSANVSVRLNNGMGVFSGTTQVGVGLRPVGIALTDLDGDKDMDMLVANSGASSVSVRLNNGMGVFSGTNEVSTAEGVWAVVAADVDGDGDMDLASANATAGSVSVRLNNGLGVFSGTGTVMVGTSPKALIVADLDNNQDLDLAVTNFASNSISPILNLNPPSISYISPGSGPVGTSVIINGNNFKNVTTVQFNNAFAPNFTVNSEYQITAIVPASVTTGTKGTIKVTAAGGLATSTSTFAVTAAPTISSFSPANGAAGTTVIITGTEFKDISSIKFNGTLANYVINTPTQITTYVPAEATTGPISITLTGGISVNSSTSFTVLPGISMSGTSAYTCNNIFRDPGGSSNYKDNSYVYQTFTPATSGAKLRFTFTAFDTEAGYDILKVYDGSSTYAPLIGEYSGTTLPPVITATNPSGQLTFYFTSDNIFTGTGWQATISCIGPPDAPSNLVATTASATQINLSWTDTASDETGFTIERSTTPNTGFVQVATVGVNVTTYANTGLATDAQYYYRVRTSRGGVYSSYSNEASAVVGNAPIIMSNGAITTCNAVFLDPGGAGNYGYYQDVTMTLTPATAGKQLYISFISFAVESGYDYLRIYNGPNTSSPLIGSYTGYTLPSAITASNTTGQLTFRFTSDGIINTAGWQANVSCVSPTAPSLVSLNPVRNSQNIYRYTDVVMNFSQLMQATTASSAAIKIHGSLSGLLTTPTGGYFYGMGTSTASFNPSAEFKSGETVSVTITSQAKNQAGLSMAIPQVYQFTAAASYAPANFVATTPVNVPASPFGMVAADFDKDGDIDLATAHFLAAGSVSIKLNNGMGGFTGTGSVAVGTNPRALVAADFDNDGDMDLATANQLSNDVSVRFNNGLGVFSGTSSVGVGTTPIGLTAADFDGDGDMDVATANYGANTISIRFNNGLGVFSGATQVAVGVQPSWVQAADVDRDGDMDLTIANAGSANVSVRLNNGMGVFSGTTQVGVGLRPVGIALTDLDGDKDMDMLVANSGASSVSVRLNNGMGVFSGTNEVSTAEGVWAVVAADVDGDGDMDLASANATAGSVSVRLNNGLGVFSGTGTVMVSTSPKALIVADLDNDGDIDLATSNFASSSISVLRNSAPSSQNLTAARSSDAISTIENSKPQESEVYPNPFKDELKVIIKSEQTQEVFITITDTYGKVVYDGGKHTTNQEIILNTQLSSGIYVLQATYGNQVKLFKIIKAE